MLGELVTTFTPITESMTIYAHYKSLYDDYEAATERAPIYDRPSTSNGNVLGYVDAGEVVIVLKDSKKHLFSWVIHDGVAGWVQRRYLEPGNVMTVATDYKIDRAIRSKAQNRKGSVYRNIGQVELLLVIGSEGSYYKVAYPCEKGYAYIAKRQLQER